MFFLPRRSRFSFDCPTRLFELDNENSIAYNRLKVKDFFLLSYQRNRREIMGRRSTVKRHDILETANIRLLRACGQRAMDSGESIAQASAAYEALRRYPPLNSRVEEPRYHGAGSVASSVLKKQVTVLDVVGAYPISLRHDEILPIAVPSLPEKQGPKVHGVNAQRESRTRPKVGGAGNGKRS
jgi:hypothetical protein